MHEIGNVFIGCFGGDEMSYRIDYGYTDIKVQNPGNFGKNLKTFTAAALLLFACSVNLFWPAGKEQLQEILLPGERTTTALAAEQMLVQIREGNHLQEALRTFCLEILADADPV